MSPRFAPALRVAVFLAAIAALPAARAWAQGIVTGTVIDADGRPVAGATVVGHNPSASPDTVTLTADKRGRFAVVGLRGGTWLFVAGAYGYEPAQVVVRVGGLRVNIVPNLRLARTPGPPPGALEGIDPGPVLEDLAKADRLREEGNLDAAIAAYRALLARAPALTTINLLVGAACVEKGDDGCAVEAYKAAIAADAAPDRARVELGRLHLRRGDTQAALAVLLEATSSPEASADAWTALGDAYAQAGNAEQAERAYRRAEQIDPEARRKSG